MERRADEIKHHTIMAGVAEELARRKLSREEAPKTLAPVYSRRRMTSFGIVSQRPS